MIDSVRLYGYLQANIRQMRKSRKATIDLFCEGKALQPLALRVAVTHYEDTYKWKEIGSELK